MKISFLLGFILIAAMGCNKSNTTEPPISSAHDSLSYQMAAYGMQPLRSGEYLFMWVKIAPDTGWINVSMPQLHDRSSDGTANFIGKLYSLQPLDSIKAMLLTVEKTLKPVAPGLAVIRGSSFFLDSAKAHLTMALDSRSMIGDYSLLQGSLVFTSPLPDTTAYKHEFYLMNMLGSQQTPSLLSLNQLPSGWKYGLWAEDTNFTPHQYFFYGLFSTSQGHDSDSTNDHYPFPGGWKPQTMSMASGSIIVTLEPEFYGDSLKYKGPSSFALLDFERITSIQKNKNYPMINITASGIPSGTITFRTN